MKAWIGVNVVEECIFLKHCPVIKDKASIQLASPFAKTDFWRRSLVLRLNLCPEATLKDVFLDNFSVLFLIKGLVKELFLKLEPSLASIIFGFILESLRMFSKEFVLVWAF